MSNLIDQTIDELCELSAESLDAMSREVAAAVTRLRLCQGRLMMAMQINGAHLEFGCSKVTHYATAILRYDLKEATSMRKVAACLDYLPMLTAAAEAGEISWSALDAVVKRCDFHNEQEWLKLAQELSTADLRRVARQERSAGGEARVPQEIEIRTIVDADTASLYNQATRSLCEEAGRRLDGSEVLTALCYERLAGAAFPNSTAIERFRREFERDTLAEEARDQQITAQAEQILAGAAEAAAAVAPASPSSSPASQKRVLADQARPSAQTSGAQQPTGSKDRITDSEKASADAHRPAKTSRSDEQMVVTAPHASDTPASWRGGLLEKQMAPPASEARQSGRGGLLKEQTASPAAEPLEPGRRPMTPDSSLQCQNSHHSQGVEHLTSPAISAAKGLLAIALRSAPLTICSLSAMPAPALAHGAAHLLASALRVFQSRTLDGAAAPSAGEHGAASSGFNHWNAMSVRELPCPGDCRLTLIRPGPSFLNPRLRYDGAQRHLTEAQRREILRRDGYCCQVPGCEHMLFLHAHHIVAYADGGLTVPDNLVMICSACHRTLHDGHLRLQLTSDGLRWTDQRGRSLTAYRPCPAPEWLVQVLDKMPPAA